MFCSFIILPPPKNYLPPPALNNLLQHPRHPCLPVRQGQTKNRLQAPRVQPRVVRAAGGGGVLAGSDGLDALHFQRLAALPGLVNHVAGQFVPVGAAGGGQVIEARFFRLAQGLGHGVGGDVGNQRGSGGRAPLVVDDAKLLALGRQAQHGFDEVAAARGIHPAGAKDQVRATTGGDSLLAFELGGAINVQVMDFPESNTKYEFTKTSEKPKAYDDAVKKITW